MYSIGLSSPTSRLAVYLAAGNAFGAIFSRTRPLPFVTTTDAIVPIANAMYQFIARDQATKGFGTKPPGALG